MFRYFSIYNDKDLDVIIQKKYGLSIKDIYTIGLLFWGAYIDNLAIYYPPKIEVEEINKEKIDKFLKFFSEDISTLKKIIADSNKLNENFFYQFNPLKYFPIIRGLYMGKDALICPVPTFLFWKLTGGIYYDLIKEKNFDNTYGKAFENYINEVLEKTNLRNLQIYRDEEYSSQPGILKKTVDFIIGYEKEILFIECKAKRLSTDSQTLIDINEKVDKDYSILAKGIFQLYKTLDDYLNNLYPDCKYKNQLIYPLVLTLEDWFISGHSDIGVDHAWVDSLFAGYNRRNSQDINQKFKIIYVAVDSSQEVVGIIGATPKKGEPIKAMPLTAKDFQAFVALLIDAPYLLKGYGRKLYTHINPTASEVIALQRFGWKLNALMPEAYKDGIITQQWGFDFSDDCTRALRVKSNFLKLVKNGEKTLEVRVLYAMIDKIITGDHIKLFDYDESIVVEIKNHRIYRNFPEMLEHEDPNKIAPGYSKENLLNLLRNFYSAEKEELGVIVFEIMLLT